MKPEQATAIRVIVLGVAVLALAVVVTIHFEVALSKINWRLVALLCGVALIVFAIYHWQTRRNNSYDVLDMVTIDGKADLGRHLTIFSFVMASWVIVQQALSKQPVTELVLGVLGFFVAKEALNGFSSAMKGRPPAVDQSQNVNVLSGANVNSKQPIVSTSATDDEHPLSPAIAQDDVGKRVAIVTQTKKGKK